MSEVDALKTCWRVTKCCAQKYFQNGARLSGAGLNLSQTSSLQHLLLLGLKPIIWNLEGPVKSCVLTR